MEPHGALWSLIGAFNEERSRDAVLAAQKEAQDGFGLLEEGREQAGSLKRRLKAPLCGARKRCLGLYFRGRGSGRLGLCCSFTRP